MKKRVEGNKIARILRLSKRNDELIRACAKHNNVSQNYVINKAIEDFLSTNNGG